MEKYMITDGVDVYCVEEVSGYNEALDFLVSEYGVARNDLVLMNETLERERRAFESQTLVIN